MGIVNAGGSVGQLMLVPASMALLLWSDWRTTYLLPGGTLLLVGVPITVLVLWSQPQDLGLLPDGVTACAADASPGEVPLQPSHTTPLEAQQWQAAFTSSPMWLLIGGFFVCGFTLATISTHFVAFATDRGIAPGTAAAVLGVIGAFNIAGTLLAGTVSDQLGRKNPLALIYLLRSAACAVLLIANTPWALYLFAVLVGLSWFSTVPLTVSLSAEIYGIRHMGTLVGLIFTSHQIGGALRFITSERLTFGLQQMVAYLHVNGVTAYNEPGVIFTPEIWKLYQQVLGAEDTPFYSYFLPDARQQVDKGLGLAESLADAERQVAIAPAGKVSFFPRQIKLFADGAIISQLMQMQDGYLDGHQGEWLMTPEKLDERTKLYWDSGYQLHIHVNGEVMPGWKPCSISSNGGCANTLAPTTAR
jgi:sugar phosphate permease